MNASTEARMVGRIVDADARHQHVQRLGRSLTEANSADELYFPAPMVCGRYHISDMTLWRWCKDERMLFPAPIYFGRYRYWKLSDLVGWERERAAAKATAA